MMLMVIVMAGTGCTKAKLINRQRAENPIGNEDLLDALPGTAIVAGGGIASSPQMMMIYSIGDVGDPAIARGTNMMVLNGIQGVLYDE